jgi:hypothetical protein
MQGDLVFFFFEITLGRSDQVQVQTLASREGLHVSGLGGGVSDGLRIIAHIFTT